jgi:diguanylate cyclase (GGDEF)-like protein
VGGRILVVDGDPVVRRFLVAEIGSYGHEVEAVERTQLLQRAGLSRPDLVLLDAGTHTVDVLRSLRADPRTAWLPVLLLADDADPEARALGLAAGADDCLAKPFDLLELSARIEGTLRRSADVRSLSPLTGLPGNHRIDVEAARRASLEEPYAVCHIDLDEFKGFNDAYGFQRGDGLLLLLAACFQRGVLRASSPPAFLGHVGGDDFVVLCTPDQVDELCASAIAEFDAHARQHYDAEDADRGYLETVDRRGDPRRQPLVSVSVGVAVHRGGPSDHRALVVAANEMKTVAKGVAGSHVAVDRRT